MKFIVISVFSFMSFFINFVKVFADTQTLDLTAITHLDGKKFDATSEIQPSTEKLMVMFWGSWCRDCKPKLKSTLLKLDENPKIKVMAINMDQNVKRANKYIQKNELKIETFRDEDRKLIKQLKVFAVPHWAVFEKKVGGDDKVFWNLKHHEAAFDKEKVAQMLEVNKESL